jgi:hypothetical protein
MREIRMSGSEGGGANSSPYPYIAAQGSSTLGFQFQLLFTSRTLKEFARSPARPFANAFSVAILWYTCPRVEATLGYN